MKRWLYTYQLEIIVLSAALLLLAFTATLFALAP
jgi:hypothetical protein